MHQTPRTLLIQCLLVGLILVTLLALYSQHGVESEPEPTVNMTRPIPAAGYPDPPLSWAEIPTPPPGVEWMTVVALVTAYTPGIESCGDSADGRTSTNRSTDIHPYGIAADGAVLPPGSLIKVPEYMDVSFPDRAWEVDDTGGDMRKNFREHYIVHLDLRYRTVVSANKVGRQWMEISVNVTGWPEERRERLRLASHHGWWMREEGKLPK